MRAPHRDAEELAGQHVGGAVGAADVGGPAAAQPAVGALGPAQAELHQLVAAAGQPDARRLGGDERLEVERVEHHRLEELRLDERSLHLQHGLVREDDGPLGHRLDGAARAERRQVLEEGVVEGAQAGQIVAGPGR